MKKKVITPLFSQAYIIIVLTRIENKTALITLHLGLCLFELQFVSLHFVGAQVMSTRCTLTSVLVMFFTFHIEYFLHKGYLILVDVGSPVDKMAHLSPPENVQNFLYIPTETQTS